VGWQIKAFLFLEDSFMRIFLLSVFLASLFSSITAQTREKAIEQFTDFERKIEAVKKESQAIETLILQPDESDLVAAEQKNFKVSRLLPREKYDKDFFIVRGGGSYYSFTKQSHSYDQTPQIGLEQNTLKVGFYGASYGFIANLGVISLSELDEKTENLGYLLNYQVSTEETDARNEYRRISGKFEQGGINYTNRLPVSVGGSYVLRAISFDEADVLVAFKVYRQDADGSLIIFWKLIKNFDVPKMNRNFSGM
jgi:hypothetical protein